MADDDDGFGYASGGQHLQRAEQDRDPVHLDEALGHVVGEGPEALAEPCGEDDCGRTGRDRGKRFPGVGAPAPSPSSSSLQTLQTSRWLRLAQCAGRIRGPEEWFRTLSDRRTSISCVDHLSELLALFVTFSLRLRKQMQPRPDHQRLGSDWMSAHRRDEHRLEYDVVRSYWEEAAREAESASYMVHEQGLPRAAVSSIASCLTGGGRPVVRWTGAHSIGDRPRVRRGAWTELPAQRYERVVGVDASAGMLAAARQRLAGQDNVELVPGDALTVAVDGEFQGVLLGGLLMYLDRADAVALLVRLGQLAPRGRIILREIGGSLRGGGRDRHLPGGVPVPAGVRSSGCRSWPSCRRGRAQPGLRPHGGCHRGRQPGPPLAGTGRRDPALVGRPLWRLLQATAPVTLGFVPRAVEAVGIDWPHLTNHFLLLEASP